MWKLLAANKSEYAYRLARRLAAEAEKSKDRMKPWEREDWWRARLCTQSDHFTRSTALQLERQLGGIDLVAFRSAMQELLGNQRGSRAALKDIDALFASFDTSGTGIIPLAELVLHMKAFGADAKISVPGCKENTAARRALYRAEEERKTALAEAEAELAELEALAEADFRARAMESMSPEAMRQRTQQRRLALGITDPCNRYGFRSVAEVKAFFKANGRLSDFDRWERRHSTPMSGHGARSSTARSIDGRAASLRQAEPEMIDASTLHPPSATDSRHRRATMRGRKLLAAMEAPDVLQLALLEEPDEEECYLTLAIPSTAPTRRLIRSATADLRPLSPIGEYEA